MAVTKILTKVHKAICYLSALAALLILQSVMVSAAILPEDRTDILYHGYDGGGMNIDGPSILVRKSIGNRVSVWGNYYEDLLTSASVDVVTQGSPYTEERVESSVGADFLHNKTLMSLSFTNSSENDYEASTVGFAISQDFFGDLTTLSLNYSLGNDEVRTNVRDPDTREIIDATDRGEAEHQRYGMSLTQILTKHLIASFTAETVVDEGFLNNPYRSVRYYTDLASTQIASKPEAYPNTRSSDAYAIRAMYYLPYRAAIRLEHRSFSDSWGITASNQEIRYIHPMGNWTFEAKYRQYSQTAATFYADTFSLLQHTNQDYFASDKEMDAFSDTTIGLGVSYALNVKRFSFLEKATVNLFLDNISFSYENYRDKTQSQPGENGEAPAFAQGQEPLYSFNANVVRFFVSFWY